MSEAYVAHVRVELKPGVLDPQGAAVLGGLRALGFDGVSEVRVGKWITVTLTAGSEPEARRAVEAMCRRLLANPVLESYRFELAPAGRAATGTGGDPR